MNEQAVEQIANAVLYEGYNLYPYRPSLKNSRRWTLGGIYPWAYVQANPGADNWFMQAQCLVRGSADAAVDVQVRFLHLVDRTVGRVDPPLSDSRQNGFPTFTPVPSLTIGGKQYLSWQEAVERRVSPGRVRIEDVRGAAPRRTEIAFPRQRELQPLAGEDGRVAGALERASAGISGWLDVRAERADTDAFRLTVRVENRTEISAGEAASRDAAGLRSMLSTHMVLGVTGGEFISLVDPPEEWGQLALECQNIGAFPVLVGEEGRKDTMLASPIILYDYPRVAPESPGDFFDATEIDEMLTLRILTMTDEEKAAMSRVDARSAALLDRTEDLARLRLDELHGTMRNPTGGIYEQEAE